MIDGLTDETDSRETADSTDTLGHVPTVPVVMCVWNRIDRTKKVLRAIAQSQGVTAQVYLWNNRADAAEEIVDDLRSCDDPLPRTVLVTCDMNIGGFGRFYWAKALASASPFVIFVDDDQGRAGDLCRNWWHGRGYVDLH